jgi:protoporphyrin/coproporphyrin ferrochelatase
MKTAVLISNMGGPDSQDDIQEYLYNIFSDPYILDIPLPSFFRKRFVEWFSTKRVPKSREIYSQIGGKSPLLEITQKQAVALETVLNPNGPHYKVFVAMRYWHPLVEEVWKKVMAQNFEKIIVVSLYPFYSTTTTGSLVNLVKNLVSECKTKVPIEIIDRFGSDDLFIQAMYQQIIGSIGPNEKGIDLLLSTHSIPLKRIKNGDPFQKQVEDAAKKLELLLPDNIKVHLCYQSKIGPVKWLGPSTQDKIKEIAKNGAKELVVYPFGFVADNSETIYEIGMLYQQLAAENDITNYKRIDALNDEPLFIETLKSKILALN